jgi:hypothetical protein
VAVDEIFDTDAMKSDKMLFSNRSMIKTMENADQAHSSSHTSYFCDVRDTIENRRREPAIFESHKYTD